MTNKELAKKLNISETTLSFIVNNKPGIAEKTRARVIQSIRDLGYGHIFKKETAALTRNVCFLVHKRHGSILNQSPFFMLLMEQIDDRARALGCSLVLRMVDTDDSLSDHIRELNASDIQGAIVFATEMLDEDMACFREAEMPLVSMDNDFTHLGFDSVVINNRVGAYLAVEHLAAIGHREIGYLQCKNFINSFGEREEGYRKAFRHFGLELAPGHLHRLGYTEEESYHDFKRVLQAGAELPTAFVSDDDTVTVGVMRALAEHGVDVPGDVSLVGFNDRPVCELTRPRLTSVSVPKGLFGALAVELLAERMERPAENRADFRKVEVGVELAVRESSGNASKGKCSKFMSK